MKTTGIFILLLFLTLQCKGQEAEKVISPVNYLDLIEGGNINITTIRPEGKEPVTCPDYVFSDRRVNEINGLACLYAVPKDLSDAWVKESSENPREICAQDDRYTDFHYSRCEAQRMFREDTLKLLKDFELYVFHVDMAYLEGPFQESSESGPADYYVPIPQAPAMVYSYQQGQWVLADITNLKDQESIRVFGYLYLQEKFAR